MKLKKIASLMLAGIMAVSMLAGCKGASSSTPTNPDEPVAPGMVGKVIAALDENVTKKVNFSADSELQTVLDAYVANLAGTATAVDVDGLLKLNPGLGSKDLLPETNATLSTSESKDKVVQKTVNIAVLSGSMTDDFAAYNLANMIKNADVYDASTGSKKIADLPEKTAVDAKSEYRYTFDYTGGIAVASIDNVTAGTSLYVVAYRITRTPTKVDI